MTEGSMWRKWDLHVHSPESHTHEFRFQSGEAEKYSGDIWEKYVEAIERSSDVPVVGITDYFSIDGYEKILEYKHAGRLDNIALILPNIEFRLDKFLSSKSDTSAKRLNYHVIFSDELSPEKIRTEFLQEIHIETETGEKRTLNRGNIQEIGANLKEQHEPFRGRDDYYVGCMNVFVSLDEIRKILFEKVTVFEGKYLLVLADEYWSQASWDGQDHLIRKTLLRKSNAIFGANPRTRDWALGMSDEYENPAAFIEEFGSLFPCLHGSDAHSFDTLFRPDLDRYCWIKADTTFEGLKQTVFEPEARVRIQQDNPEPWKTIFTIDAFEIENSDVGGDLTIKEESVEFNWNLVAVTGGKREWQDGSSRSDCELL